MKTINVQDYTIDADVAVNPNSDIGIIISNGSSNDMNHKIIKTLFEKLKEKYSVIRFNFSYVNGKRKRANSTNIEEIRQCMQELGSKKIVLIGKSYGGYLSTLLSTESSRINKVIVLGYPLHKQNNPSELYPQDHLTRSRATTVFIVGDKDQYCDIPLLRKMLSSPKIHVINNSNHSFESLDRNNVDANLQLISDIVLRELEELKA